MVLLPIYHAKWLNAFPLLRGVQIFPKRSNGWRMLLANHVEKHVSYKWFFLLFFLPFSPTPEVMIEYYANDRKWPQPTTPFFCSCFCGSARLNLAAQAVLKFAILSLVEFWLLHIVPVRTTENGWPNTIAHSIRRLLFMYLYCFTPNLWKKQGS